VLFVVVWNCSC